MDIIIAKENRLKLSWSPCCGWSEITGYTVGAIGKTSPKGSDNWVNPGVPNSFFILISFPMNRMKSYV